MSRHLKVKWRELEKRKNFYVDWGENYAVLERAKRDYKEPPQAPHSFPRLLNKRFKVENNSYPQPDTPDVFINPYSVTEKQRQALRKKRNPK